MRTVRSYSKLLNEIINLTIPFRIEIIGYVSYFGEIYPMIAIRHISKIARKNIVIVSGQHGDEYFAVQILLKWLSQIKLEDYSEFNWTVIPVANPFGYSKSTRRNGARQQVNNADKFKKDSEVKELSVLYEHIPSSLNLYLDIHGDTGKKCVYAYERKPEGFPSITGPALINNDNILPYEKVNTIYLEKVQNGIIYKPIHDRSLDDFMGNLGVEYTVTLELPGKCEGQSRTIGGIGILNSIITNFKDIK
jgi:predicted deacylase